MKTNYETSNPTASYELDNPLVLPIGPGNNLLSNRNWRKGNGKLPSIDLMFKIETKIKNSVHCQNVNRAYIFKCVQWTEKDLFDILL